MLANMRRLGWNHGSFVEKRSGIITCWELLVIVIIILVLVAIFASSVYIQRAIEDNAVRKIYFGKRGQMICWDDRGERVMANFVHKVVVVVTNDIGGANAAGSGHDDGG